MSYQRVYTEFWRDTRDWPEDERLLALYLLTSRHTRQEGLFNLPVAYAADDIGWSKDRVSTVLARLVGRRWAMQNGDWVLIVNALRYDQPNRGNQMKGAAKVVAAAPLDTDIYRTFYAKAREFCPELAYMLHPPIAASQPPAALDDIPWWGDDAEPRTTDDPPMLVDGEIVAAAPPAEPQCPKPVRDMLAQAGFADGEIKEADGALRFTVGQLALPHDTDWDRYAREINRLRDDGTLRRPGPVAALRFIANGASGPPRLGKSPRGGSSLDHYKKLDAAFAAEETETV